ncbi:uncharacterized protein LOC110054494 [Orbicella faveolata]|uniref:uncharacterized protein LOC110054494 n=1 Tax=Orbicella faveolata TaxID=48498 RepID=UPI0009E3FB36|nr:uncharacterized protein LOC110054494 [Orbicella faveolata]
MLGHSASPNVNSSPSSKNSPSAMKRNLPSNKNSSLNLKRPLSKMSSLSEKSKMFKHSSSEQPLTAKEARPSTHRDPSSSLNDTCNSTSAARPQSKTAMSCALGSSGAASMSSRSSNNPRNHPSRTAEPPKSSAMTTTSPQTESGNESSHPEPLPKVASQFQCQDCGLQLSSRNCLYKHKMRKHKTTNEGPKAKESKHVWLECTGKQSRRTPLQ